MLKIQDTFLKGEVLSPEGLIDELCRTAERSDTDDEQLALLKAAMEVAEEILWTKGPEKAKTVWAKSWSIQAKDWEELVIPSRRLPLFSHPPSLRPSLRPSRPPSVPPSLRPSLRPSVPPSLPPSLPPSHPPTHTHTHTLPPSLPPSLPPYLFDLWFFWYMLNTLNVHNRHGTMR